MEHGGASVSGPLPMRSLQVPGGSQRALRSASSSSPPSASPREFARAHPIPEEGEAPAAGQDAAATQEPREQKQQGQKEVRRGWFG